MNYCSNCGTKLETNAAFCHNCGTKVIGRANSTQYGTTSTAGQKSKFLAGILAILLGTLGIHNFYLGYTKKGIAQLLLFVFFLGSVSCLWGIIEAIMIFTDKINCDAKGNPLADNI
ncbi:MAG: TM2 domain-containing protein [Oscillospiraceae bacterium]|nr:TM2 domain-containing protein [Oscillospiraceae bacterium]